ncbi:MAG: hypothetical protein AB1405_11945 [Bdellovibrionota bacterium]
MRRSSSILAVLVPAGALFWASLGLASQPVRLSVSAVPAKIKFGESVRLAVTVENTGDVEIAYKEPRPPFQVWARGGEPNFSSDDPVELVPCVARGKCPAVRLAPGKKANFEIDVTPTRDLGISSAGQQEIEVRARFYVFEPGLTLPKEEWAGGDARIEILDKVDDPLYACPDRDERLTIAVEADPGQGSQEEIRLNVELTNRTEKILSIPREMGCPNAYEPLRLYPPDYQGHVEELGKVRGPGIPEACSFAMEQDFVTLDPGDSHEIELGLDSLSFGTLSPATYEAVVVFRNEVTHWTQEAGGGWRPLQSPWTGCLRAAPVTVEIRP